MLSSSVILRNIGSVWLGFGVQLAITLYLTPILISKLGPEGYGIWILIQSLTGYYGLIDMGLRAGVTQTVTKRIASGDMSTLVNYIGGVLPLLAKASALILIAGIIVGYTLSNTLDVSRSLREILFPIVIIQVVGIGFTLLSFPFSSVLVGTQRYDIAEGLAVVTRLISLAGTLSVLNYTNNLFYLALTHLGVNVFDQFARCVIAVKLIPDLTRIRPKSNRSELSELYRVGGWNFVVSISQQILQRFNTLLAAYLFSISNLVPFSLAGSLAEHSGKITTLASRVLFPTFSHLSQNEQASDTQRLFQIASRISLTISLIAITVGLIWFEPFMNLWLKNVNQKEDVIASAKPLFLAFGLINVLNSIRSVGWQLILGNDEVEFLGRTMVRESILAIVLSLVLGIGIGVIGLVLGNLIAICISTFWICLPTFSKMINVSNVSNLQAIFLRPIIYSIAIGLGLLSWSRWVTNPENWLELLIFCALPTIAVLMIATPLLLTKTERTIVSSRLFRLLKPT